MRGDFLLTIAGMLNRRPNRLLLLAVFLVVSTGCVTQPASGPLADAELNLKQARRARADPQRAAGDYLDAADAALRSTDRRSAEESPEARLTYNTACQELAVLLQSSGQLWDRTETIESRQHIYRLRFAAGSRQAGTWDTGYVDFFRTPRQLRIKRPNENLQKNGWGGVLVGVHSRSSSIRS